MLSEAEEHLAVDILLVDFKNGFVNINQNIGNAILHQFSILLLFLNLLALHSGRSLLRASSIKNSRFLFHFIDSGCEVGGGFLAFVPLVLYHASG